MEIKIINGINIAEIESDDVLIGKTQDALDIMGNADYRGAKRIILKERNFTPDFFDLKTGIAGEILQKFSTYGVQLAIIGDYSKYASKSLRDFIFECNKYGKINFVNSKEEAIASLAK